LTYSVLHGILKPRRDMGIRERIEEVRDRIRIACERAGRRPDEVILVAVTKAVPVHLIEEAIEAGVEDIGENRFQEAREKFEEIGRKVRWHMVGHLQRNKVKGAIQIFDVIHSLDRIELAEEIEKRASAEGKVVRCLVQVNVSREPTKFGISEEDLIPFLMKVSELKHLKVEGLMTIAPFLEKAEEARPYFRRLRELKEMAEEEGIYMKHLSMGMTADFEVAVEEGATMVRIGTAIFGPRG